MQKYIRLIAFGVVLLNFLFPQFAHAEDVLGKADRAVAGILFEYDGATEFASYVINENGHVDITFARNTPDQLYSEILNKLQHHPDISGVLSGKGGPSCALF